MKIFNKKDIKEIEIEEKENAPAALVEAYEIIASMGEEVIALTEKVESLTNEVSALKGGEGNG